VPVIGSDSGAIPGVIGDAGLVFQEGDVSALAAQLAALQASPGQRGTLGARGRQRVLTHFSNERIADETVEVYRSL
jgi:glycosyltransferase involved in cell wall biosynthesis